MPMIINANMSQSMTFGQWADAGYWSNIHMLETNASTLSGWKAVRKSSWQRSSVTMMMWLKQRTQKK
jgi:hypothetical protein